jgi:hypothetical protein
MYGGYDTMVKELKKSDYPKPMSFVALVFWTGLFGGIFWGTIGYISYFFNFTDVAPNAILEPWTLGDWKKGWLGTVISIFLMGVLSVIVAYVYYFTLRKVKGIWFGWGYGIVLFLMVFFVLNPLIPSIKPLFELSRDTIITSVCLFSIYGIFIGYSINYEYELSKVQEKEATT